MIKQFSPQMIGDHAAHSDSMTRFIASLSSSEAKECIEYELKHEKRNHVLALLTAQVTATVKVEPTPDSAAHAQILQQGGLDLSALPSGAQAVLLNALQLSRAHIRCPLEGNALVDLRASLDTALSFFGVRS